MVLAEHRHGATAHEDVELRELHLLRLVDVARRTHHQEEHLAVPLELRPLPGMHEVFDEQRSVDASANVSASATVAPAGAAASTPSIT